MGASSVHHLLLLSLLGFCFSVSHQQPDSCSTGVAVSHLVPFNSTAFHCIAVWKQEDFVLRYKNTGPSQWSFILSAPDKGSYVAVGFSGKGLMIGSSAVVGWSSNGKGTVKQYYLGGKSPDECTPDKGGLKLVKNKAVVVSHSGWLYLAFQLSTDYPQPHLIYAVGPDGDLPSANSLLPVHRSMSSRSFNYTSGLASSAGEEARAAGDDGVGRADARRHDGRALLPAAGPVLVLQPHGHPGGRLRRRHRGDRPRLPPQRGRAQERRRAQGARNRHLGHGLSSGDGDPRPAGQVVQGEAVLELVPPLHRPRGDPPGHRQHLPGPVHRAGGQRLHRLLRRLRRRVGDRRRRVRDEEVLPGRRLIMLIHRTAPIMPRQRCIEDWP